MSFLRIENPVKHIPTINTIKTLGVSDKRGTDGFIGCFGSGFKYSLALFARHGLLDSLKVCIGKQVFTFDIVPEKAVDTNGYEKTISTISMKQQGGGTFPLNMSIDFGVNDWHELGLGLREFISNAYDGAFQYDGTYSGCELTEVEDNQCRAADGLIRVYVKMTEQVRAYYENVRKHFLVSNDNYNPSQMILPNKTRDAARVYRKGVLVGEFGERSLNHYNIKDLDLKESRVVDSYEAINKISRALMMAPVDIKSDFLLDALTDRRYFESKECSVHYLNPGNYYSLSQEQRDQYKADYKQAYIDSFGDTVMCLDSSTLSNVRSKGISARLIDNTDMYDLLRSCGVRTYIDVLSKHEIEGRVIEEPTPAIIEAFKRLWGRLDAFSLVGGHKEPQLKMFTQPMNGAALVMGFYEDDTVFIHKDYSGGSSDALDQTMLEEIAHCLTGAADFTRDFQDFAFRVAIAALKSQTPTG